MKKLLITFFVLCFSCLPLSACKNVDTNKIKLTEVTHSVFYAPLYVALEEGYFKDEGLTIELNNGQGANNCMSQIISGQADIGLMGPEASIYVYNEGRENYPIIFGQLTNCDGSFIMAREKDESFTLDKMIGKEILGGRKGGVPAMSLESALRKNNILDKVNFNDTVQFSMMVGAFVSGTADYCTVFEPTASMLEKEGSAYVVDSVSKYSGKLPFTAFMCSKSYLNARNKQVNGFMKAIIKAMNFVESNDSLTIANAIKNQFPSTSIDILSSSIKRYKDIGAYRVNPVMSKDDFNALQKIIIDSNIMTKYANFERIVDNSIAEKLLNK